MLSSMTTGLYRGPERVGIADYIFISSQRIRWTNTLASPEQVQSWITVSSNVFETRDIKYDPLEFTLADRTFKLVDVDTALEIIAFEVSNNEHQQINEYYLVNRHAV